MGVTLDSIRQLNITGDVTLQHTEGAINKSLQGATVSQKIGAFFHTDASKARNAEVVSTLKKLVASEPRYAGIHEHAKGLVDNIKIDKPIQGTQLREIVDYLDKMSTDKELMNTSMARLMGRMREVGESKHRDFNDSGAFGVPKELKDAPEHIKALYNKTLATSFEGAIQSVRPMGKPADRMSTILELALSKQYSLDSIVSYAARTSKDVDLPQAQQEQAIKLAMDPKRSRGEVMKTIARFQVIHEDKKIAEPLKAMAYKLALGDDNGIPSDADFNQMQVTRQGMSARNTFVQNLKDSGQVESALKAMGLNDPERMSPEASESRIAMSPLCAKVCVVINEKLTDELIAHRPISEAKCQEVLENVLQSYKGAMAEIDASSVNAGEKKLAVIQLINLASVPKAGFFTEMAKVAQGMDAQFVGSFSHATTYQERDTAMKAIADHAFQVMSATPQHVLPELDSFKTELVRFGLNHAIASMSEADGQAFADNMSTREQVNLQRFYDASAKNRRASQLNSTGNIMYEATIQLFEPSDVAMPATLIKDDIPPSVRTQFFTDELFTGEVKLFNPSGDVRAEDVTALRQKNYDSLMQVTFQSEMRKLYSDGETVFERDITRFMDISLPDGSKVPNNFAQAKDSLARFVTGSPNASYDIIEPADRVKVNVILAHVSQEMEKAADFASRNAMEHYGCEEFSLTNLSMQDTRSFSLQQSDDGDLTIQYAGKLHGSALVHGNGRFDIVRDDSHTLYEVTVAISNTELDRLSHLDWDAFSAIPESGLSASELYDARPHLDEAFCCNAEYSVSAQYNIYSSTDA